MEYMKQALKQAELAYRKDEVPVGCIIEYKGKIIARAHNLIKTKKDPTAHAEILAITKASRRLKNERLTGCNMYATLEPCPMCAGAIIHARINKLAFGTNDPKTGACGSVYRIINNKKNNHTIKLERNMMKSECSEILKTFFRNKRK